MGGRGETVTYTRFFRKTLTPQQKADLKKKIDHIIEHANHSLTIITLEGTGPLPGGGAGWTDFEPPEKT
jgi:hypothetical protein